MKKYLLLVTVQLLLFQAYAQNQLQVSGDFRMRSEYRHGFSTPVKENQNNAFFTDQRSRITIDYMTDKYVVKLSLQDIRVWGNQSQLAREDGNLTAMHEAWGEVLFTKAFSLRVGRQEIALDDHRIFGNVDWLMQARSHDAALFKYKKNGFESQAGFAYNQDKIQNTSTYYTIPNNYKALQLLWLHKEYKNVGASLLFLNNGRQGGTPNDYHTAFSQTLGTRLTYKKERIKANLFYYHQLGTEPDSLKTSIDAFDLGFDCNYQLSDPFSITAGLEILTGNNQGSAVLTNKAFNPFYGTNHKFNGLMDYFYVNNHINSVGLEDFYAHLNYGFKKVTASLQGHYFRSYGEIIDVENGTAAGRSLGTEIDLNLQYKYSDDIKFDAGYSQFLATKGLEAVKGGDRSANNNWFWVMVSFKPVFYKTPSPQQ